MARKSNLEDDAIVNPGNVELCLVNKDVCVFVDGVKMAGVKSVKLNRPMATWTGTDGWTRFVQDGAPTATIEVYAAALGWRRAINDAPEA